MTDRDTIHLYLKSLSKYLSRLEKAAADDVIREIESHIYDALEQQEAAGQPEDAKAILAGFGEARELAAGYVEHILDGAAPPKGFRAIQRVKKGATRGLYGTTALLGFSFAAALIFVGLFKPFEPDMVGLWTTKSGNSMMLGISAYPPEGSYEVLGWWIIPVSIGLGVGIGYLTKRLLSILKEEI